MVAQACKDLISAFEPPCLRCCADRKEELIHQTYAGKGNRISPAASEPGADLLLQVDLKPGGIIASTNLGPNGQLPGPAAPLRVASIMPADRRLHRRQMQQLHKRKMSR
jgi:hypothetical protein